MPLPIGTFNAGNGTYAQSTADLVNLTAVVQLLALQEVSNVSRQGRALVDFAAASGWQLHRGTGGGADRTAMLVHPDLPILDAGFHLCTERTQVGRWGAGGDKEGYLGRKHHAWVTVEDPDTGHPVTMGSTHLVASTQRPAATKAARAARERRRQLYDDHIAALVDFAEDHPEALVIAGDFNGGPGYHRLNPLRAAGFEVVTRPTRGPRRIDHLWTRDAR